MTLISHGRLLVRCCEEAHIKALGQFMKLKVRLVFLLSLQRMTQAVCASALGWRGSLMFLHRTSILFWEKPPFQWTATQCLQIKVRALFVVCTAVCVDPSLICSGAGSRVECDIVYPCIGGVPNTEFLRAQFEGTVRCVSSCILCRPF